MKIYIFRRMIAEIPEQRAIIFLLVRVSLNIKKDDIALTILSPPFIQGYRIPPLTLSQRMPKRPFPPKLPKPDINANNKSIAGFLTCSLIFTLLFKSLKIYVTKKIMDAVR